MMLIQIKQTSKGYFSLYTYLSPYLLVHCKVSQHFRKDIGYSFTSFLEMSLEKCKCRVYHQIAFCLMIMTVNYPFNTSQLFLTMEMIVKLVWSCIF